MCRSITWPADSSADADLAACWLIDCVGRSLGRRIRRRPVRHKPLPRSARVGRSLGRRIRRRRSIARSDARSRRVSVDHLAGGFVGDDDIDHRQHIPRVSVDHLAGGFVGVELGLLVPAQAVVSVDHLAGGFVGVPDGLRVTAIRVVSVDHLAGGFVGDPWRKRCANAAQCVGRSLGRRIRRRISSGFALC